MKRKWKDTGGETLVEVLAAILIGTLSVALLFGTVLASINIGRKAETADKNFSESLIKAEEQTTAVDVITVTGATDNKVKVAEKKSDAGGVSYEEEVGVEVNFYGGEGAWSFAIP